MDPQQVHQQQQQVQLVDVREPQEWHAGRIPGADWIPMNELPDRLDEIDRHRPVVTVCRSGIAAARWPTSFASVGIRPTISTVALKSGPTRTCPCVHRRTIGRERLRKTMLFEQFYLQSLGHASYLIGDDKTGQALLFDPRRDVDIYTQAARKAGLHIAFAADSHGHNDYLSGLTELRQRTGAEVWGSLVGDFSYEHRPLTDGETIEIGDIGLQVNAHARPHAEHMSLLVYDRSMSADTPRAWLSGGALLVGDLGRPDLLGGVEQAREAARVFCETIQNKLLTLPDEAGLPHPCRGLAMRRQHRQPLVNNRRLRTPSERDSVRS